MCMNMHTHVHVPHTHTNAHVHMPSHTNIAHVNRHFHANMQHMHICLALIFYIMTISPLMNALICHIHLSTDTYTSHPVLAHVQRAYGKGVYTHHSLQLVLWQEPSLAVSILYSEALDKSLPFSGSLQLLGIGCEHITCFVSFGNRFIIPSLSLGSLPKLPAAVFQKGSSSQDIPVVTSL